MQTTKKHRVLLVVSSAIATSIGAAILFAPAAFHASHGIHLASDPSLYSEVRAPGGALMVLGLLMAVGAFVRRFVAASTAIAAAVYLAYGGARLLSIALDGVPDAGLVGAAVVELVIGAACAVALVRAGRRPLAEPSALEGVR